MQLPLGVSGLVHPLTGVVTSIHALWRAFCVPSVQPPGTSSLDHTREPELSSGGHSVSPLFSHPEPAPWTTLGNLSYPLEGIWCPLCSATRNQLPGPHSGTRVILWRAFHVPSVQPPGTSSLDHTREPELSSQCPLFSHPEPAPWRNLFSHVVNPLQGTF